MPLPPPPRRWPARLPSPAPRSLRFPPFSRSPGFSRARFSFRRRLLQIPRRRRFSRYRARSSPHLQIGLLQGSTCNPSIQSVASSPQSLPNLLDMNPLWPPSSSSKRRRASQGRGAPVAVAAGSPTVASAPAVAGAPAAAVDASPTLANLQAAGFLAWWNSSPSNDGMYPPGGFTNFLQTNSTLENSHLVGNTTSTTPISPTIQSLQGTPPGGSNAGDKETINVDEDERTEKRLNWTKDEDIRLASAWVRNSKDPVDGTDRKSDQFWADVTNEYNKSTELSRRRNRNQLKIRWDRVKKPVSEFHGSCVKTNDVYRSGYSDEQLMEMAEKMYYTEHNDKDFMLKHIWKVVRNERKWSAYVQKLEQEKQSNKGGTNKRPEVVNLEDTTNIRPMGHKKAKAERCGNKKTPAAISAVSEKLGKFIEVTTMARQDREKMVENQQNLANSKVEAARLSESTADKQLKCKILNTCRELLLATTTNLNANAMAEREKALECMRMTLFSTYK